MNLQQLRYIVEVVRAGLNVSEAADALYTSQPGVSKQIRLLEEELGIEVFIRHGKRLTGVTEPGQKVVAIAERMLGEIDSLKIVGDEFRHESEGALNIACTHNQARYVLPEPVAALRKRFPKVGISLHQGSPQQVAAMLLSGEADIGIATEALAQYDQLVTLPCYRWTHSIVVPPDHPLLDGQPLTLQRLSHFPLVTYDAGYTGRSHIDEAFSREGLTPSIVLSAMDADVIKTYAELGLGVGAQVVLRRVRGGLLVQPAKTKVRLADLLAKCKGPNPHHEAWPQPVGQERL